MRSTSIFTCAAALLSTAPAQGTSVPSQLSSGFTPNDITLSVGYNGDGTQSFADGSTLQTSQVAKEPLFALGDSSAINTQTNFLVTMVDSTDPNNLVLHFMQAGFSADGDKTNIASENSPIVSYQQPGAFNEQGKRQYSFLLYSQSGSSVKAGSTPQGVPSTGKTFDISSFQKANGLKQPIAGLAMAVDFGGSSGSSSTANTDSSTQAQTSAASAAGQTSASAVTTTAASAGAGGSTSSRFIVTFQSPVIQSTQSVETTSSSASTSGASSTSTSTSIVEASASASSGSSASGSAAAASSSAGTASGSTTIHASVFCVASSLTALLAVFGGALLL